MNASNEGSSVGTLGEEAHQVWRVEGNNKHSAWLDTYWMDEVRGEKGIILNDDETEKEDDFDNTCSYKDYGEERIMGLGQLFNGADTTTQILGFENSNLWQVLQGNAILEEQTDLFAPPSMPPINAVSNYFSKKTHYFATKSQNGRLGENALPKELRNGHAPQ
ncbi:MAG: hypothetical protein JXX29_11565, partial [Deltaproteobacteria bacterium]|nr:hypothetical protein [Deltaproteobacteria bacterium]